MRQVSSLHDCAPCRLLQPWGALRRAPKWVMTPELWTIFKAHLEVWKDWKGKRKWEVNIRQMQDPVGSAQVRASLGHRWLAWLGTSSGQMAGRYGQVPWCHVPSLLVHGKSWVKDKLPADSIQALDQRDLVVKSCEYGKLGSASFSADTSLHMQLVFFAQGKFFDAARVWSTT